MKRLFFHLLLLSVSQSFSWSIIPRISLNPTQQAKNVQEFWDDNLSVFVDEPASSQQKNFDPQEKVHGIDDIVGGVPQEVMNIIDCYKNTSKYKDVKVPHALLFVGNPGTGKTSIARAMAQALKCGIVTRSGSDFVEIFVGNGARKVREAFAEARALARRTGKKVFLFIDEIDAIGVRSTHGQHNSEVQQTINALLKEMSGIENDSSIIIVAATNFVTNVDPALMRSGRFSVIEIPMPDRSKRELILKHYCQKKKLASNVDLAKIAEHTDNFSPADLEELVNYVTTQALHDKVTQLTMDYFIKGIKHIWIDRKNQGEKNVSINLDALDIAFDERKEDVQPQHAVGFNALAGDIEPEILEVLNFLKNPSKYHYFGVQEPRGILLVGLPGTGKTSLARALAQEAGIEFISVKGSEFVEIYVGNGPKKVRDLFDQARKKAQGNQRGKTMIFIDDIEAIGSRDASMNHQEARNTVAELLGQMDGFERDNSIIVVAATNCPDMLDPALLRPGRFDVAVEVPLPDLEKRVAILSFYTNYKPLDQDVDLVKIAEDTEHLSPAELKNLVNEAAKAAMFEDGCRAIGHRHFVVALEKAGLKHKIITSKPLGQKVPLPSYLQQYNQK